MPQWVVDLLVGAALIVLGIVIAEVWRKIRGLKDPPSAEEIAAADRRLAEQIDDEKDRVLESAARTFSRIHYCIARIDGQLDEAKLPDSEFAAEATALCQKARKALPEFQQIIRRDDLAGTYVRTIEEAERTCQDISAAVAQVATELQSGLVHHNRLRDRLHPLRVMMAGASTPPALFSNHLAMLRPRMGGKS